VLLVALAVLAVVLGRFGSATSIAHWATGIPKLIAPDRSQVTLAPWSWDDSYSSTPSVDHRP
jgi:hypothetical protein